MSNFLPIISTEDFAAVKALTRADREALKEKIDATDPHNIFISAGDTRNPDKRKIICPKCGNGTGSDATPIEATFDGGAWLYNCFKDCGFSGDLLKIIATEENLNLNKVDDFCQALAIGARLTGISIATIDYSTISRPMPKKSSSTKKKDRDPAELDLIKADIKTAQEHIADLPEDQRRGLSTKTLNHFGFGYIEKWINPKSRLKGQKIPPSRRIIIPTSEKQYNAVALPADRPNMKKDYYKMHAGALDGELFNACALSGNDDIVVAVEGEIDCASLWQAFEGNISVVAVLGVKNWRTTLLPKLDDISGKKFLIIFDGEDDSRKSAENLRGELIRRGLPAVCRFFYDALMAKLEAGKKISFEFDVKIDANEILQKQDSYFLRNLTQEIIDDACKAFDDAGKEIADRDIETPPITAPPTGKTSKHIADETQRELDTAISFLNALTPENFSADDAYNSENIHFVALAQTYGFTAQAEKFFATIKTAKDVANNRLAEAKNNLTAIPTNDELSKINAVIAISVNTIRDAVKREIQDLRRDQKDFIKRQEQEQLKQESIQKAAYRNYCIEENIKQLVELKNLYKDKPTPELAAKMQRLIIDSCDITIDRYSGAIKSVRATANNINLIFSFDPILTGLVGYDEFQQADVFLKSPAWRPETCKGDEWKDRDDAQLRMYLRSVYTELANKQLIYDKTTCQCDLNKFHVVKEFFYNLPEWDGVKRAESLFIKFLRVDDTPYSREVSLNWLTAAVARIFHPGCRYQTALVLHGRQGIGKSYVPERLGGAWYGAINDSVDDPHSQDAIKKIWIGEFKEMAAMRKAELNAIKSFIERGEDIRREAYARRAGTIKRHCVFVITVNDDQFLSDLTGNRRYMILHSNSAAGDYVEGLTDEYIQQVWSEVYHHYKELFKTGFDEKKLELSKSAKIEAENTAQNYLRNDIAGEIKAFIDQRIPPTVIWNLLSKEERRKFFADGGRLRLFDGFNEFAARITARGGRNVSRDIEQLTTIFAPENKNKAIRREGSEIIIYGTELREHVCAAEIFNEAFLPTDKRKSSTAINATLNSFEGWSLGKRIQKDRTYGDQKKIFFRDPDNQPTDDDSATNDKLAESTAKNEPPRNIDDLNGTPVDPNDVPKFDETDLPL